MADFPTAGGAGLRAGRYRLIREIGLGGMGAVYYALDEESEPPREAAVKMLRDSLDPEHARRFLHEQRVLAGLNHPGIARFYESGTTPEGRPFLAMEFVAGEPIDVYCDRRRLGITERLRMFRRVLDAVAYAHRQLVVHRDIKPRNILVTEQGDVKLVDFGIAKPLGGYGDDDTLQETVTGARLMTPVYASPEQVTGGRVTTATDVYALGLLLYELLCGRRAHRLDGRAPGEIERVVVREEVPKPSTALFTTVSGGGRTEKPAEEVALARRSTPPRLRRRLRGDLDRIVGMALRKEPEARYASVGLFAEDIDNFLAGLPVHARGRSTGYLLRKLVARHRVAVTAAVAVVIMLAGYFAVSVRHAAELRVALATAKTEAAKAEQVSQFLEGLFRSNDPDNAKGEEVTGRELLERGLQQVDRLSSDPVLQAQLLATIAGVYESLGEYSKARPLVERALQIREAALGPGHLDVAHSRRRLGVLLRYLGDSAASEGELRRALEIDRSNAGGDGKAIAWDLQELGHTLVELGRYEEGEGLFREALAMRREAFGSGHEDVAESLAGVAYARSRRGYPRDAVPLYSEALEIHRVRLGADHPQVARSHQNLAVNLSDVGEYAEAARHFETALSIYRTVYGSSPPSIAVTINNLANLKVRQGDLEAAEQLFRETLEMRQAIYGEEHPATIRALNNLASTLLRRDKLDDSERMFRLLIARRSLRAEPDDPEMAVYRANLSEVLRRLKRLDEAEALARLAVGTTTGNREPGLDSATAMVTLGRILVDQGQVAEGERFMSGALAIRRERLGEEHPEVKRTTAELEKLRAGWKD
jgi:eukaryotic-like serine/threonine-protein kinase